MRRGSLRSGIGSVTSPVAVARHLEQVRGAAVGGQHVERGAQRRRDELGPRRRAELAPLRRSSCGRGSPTRRSSAASRAFGSSRSACSQRAFHPSHTGGFLMTRPSVTCRCAPHRTRAARHRPPRCRAPARAPRRTSRRRARWNRRTCRRAARSGRGCRRRVTFERSTGGNGFGAATVTTSTPATTVSTPKYASAPRLPHRCAIAPDAERPLDDTDTRSPRARPRSTSRTTNSATP